MSRLQAAFDAGQFAIVCEVSPPRGASLEPLRRKAALIRDFADAALLTDGQGAQVRMASWAASLAVREAGVEPLMMLQGRDRNRIALQADMLGAAALSIPGIVLQSGDPTAPGDDPAAKECFDLDSLSAIHAAATMKHQGRLLSGQELQGTPQWLIGCVEDATAGGSERVERLAQKVEAGAQFVLTQYVFDLGRFRDFMRQVRDAGLDRRCRILPGVGPVMTPAALAFIEELPGVYLPDDMKRRLLSVTPGRMGDEAVSMAADTLRAIREEPGVAGAYLLTSGHEDILGELLNRTGISKEKNTA